LRKVWPVPQLWQQMQKSWKRCHKKKKVKLSSDEESCQDNDYTECIYCSHLYSQDNKGEKWVRCTKCLKWCHQNSADVDDWKTFICEICFNGWVTAHKNRWVLISDGTDNECYHYPILGAHILFSSNSHVSVFLCFLYLRTYSQLLQLKHVLRSKYQ
jgi:hypothetical protein